MNRSEDGINAGARNIERFALSLIPWAVGVGIVIVGIGVLVWIHEIHREAIQENRAAIYTGADLGPSNSTKTITDNDSQDRDTRHLIYLLRFMAVAGVVALIEIVVVLVKVKEGRE